LENLSRLFEAIAKLVSEFLWPGIFLFIFCRLEPNLKSLIGAMGEGSFKGFGIEVSIRKQFTEKLARANDSKTHDNETVTPGKSFREAKSIAETYITPTFLRQARRARILWVDDEPLNNGWETQALKTLGIKVVPATSTHEALRKLVDSSYSLVITDMNRAPDSEAGLTLLREMKSNANSTPVIIYGSAKTRATMRDRALELGAVAYTSLPNELIQQVCETLGIQNEFFA
jgi:CheY-like chemotaxis protein